MTLLPRVSELPRPVSRRVFARVSEGSGSSPAREGSASDGGGGGELALRLAAVVFGVQGEGRAEGQGQIGHRARAGSASWQGEGQVKVGVGARGGEKLPWRLLDPEEEEERRERYALLPLCRLIVAAAQNGRQLQARRRLRRDRQAAGVQSVAESPMALHWGTASPSVCHRSTASALATRQYDHAGKRARLITGESERRRELRPLARAERIGQAGGGRQEGEERLLGHRAQRR